MIMDGFLPPAREEDVLILNRGYWYGNQVYLPLFTRRGGPECIKAEISLLSFEGKRVARVELRAELVPQEAVDAGVPEEPRYPTDAGTP